MSQNHPLEPGSHVYLVDGSGYIFRAYHALPPLTRKSDGAPIGAVHGFCQMLFKLLEDSAADQAPTHFAVIFDASGRSFRNDFYPEYKAHRPPAPEDLVPQFPVIRQATEAFGLPSIELEGYEADDLIATYARAAEAQGADVTIISSDKDLMQLVSPRIRMVDTMKGRTIGADEVKEKFGVGPERVIDVQALAGDSTDNVPGVPGIGVKTAAQLIEEYGDLDALLARAGEIKQPKRRENLINHADLARVSRDLVTLKTDSPQPIALEEMGVAEPEPDVLVGFMEKMEFKTLTRRVREALKIEDAPGSEDDAPPGAVNHEAYPCVTKLADLEAWIARAQEAGVVAVDTETDALGSASAGLVGVSLALGANDACYIPLAHRGGDLASGVETPDQIPMKDALAALKPLFENASVLKVGQNLKYDIAVLKRYGITLSPIDDTMLISYALEGGLHNHGMYLLAELHFGHTPISFKEVAGTGKSQVSFADVALEPATKYAAEDADITWRLWKLLKPRLAAEQAASVYEKLERPMPQVLADMELAGVKVDVNRLSQLSSEFAQAQAEAEDRAHKLAGRSFNLGSPKQVGEILFGEMGLEGGKKTKTGAWSTDAAVLDRLAAEGHDLPRALLDFRTYAKLKSTYADALRAAANPETHRVHTSFSLAATPTGRLASTDPNLMNIPIRTEEGRKIREAFIAEPGHTLISADYSQVELRVLAHVAEVGALRQAFEDGLDIHAMTASEMFGVPVEGMDPMVRRKAKAINFGIIYGISAFGLAANLGIGRSEAKDYIAAYFKKFPGIKAYMEATKETARERGYVTTLMGRRCHIKGINDKNPNMRAFSERQAINAPIQGGAADIMRRAMICMPGALNRAGLKARMLLQVHDELIFEAPDAECEATCDLVSKVMREACAPVLQLAVPLIVEAQSGRTWNEAH